MWHSETNKCWSRILNLWQVLNQRRGKVKRLCLDKHIPWHCALSAAGHAPDTLKLLGCTGSGVKCQSWTLMDIIWNLHISKIKHNVRNTLKRMAFVATLKESDLIYSSTSWSYETFRLVTNEKRHELHKAFQRSRVNVHDTTSRGCQPRSDPLGATSKSTYCSFLSFPKPTTSTELIVFLYIIRWLRAFESQINKSRRAYVKYWVLLHQINQVQYSKVHQWILSQEEKEIAHEGEIMPQPHSLLDWLKSDFFFFLR